LFQEPIFTYHFKAVVGTSFDTFGGASQIRIGLVKRRDEKLV